MLNEIGWLYYPKTCIDGGCKLAVIMHGCSQQAGEFMQGDQGWTSVAHLNNIVLLFPNSGEFPIKCWDMSNMLGRDTFATNEGPQEQALMAMIETLKGTIDLKYDYLADNYYKLIPK